MNIQRIVLFLLISFNLAFQTSENNFVQTKNTEFILNGKPFYFSGTNNYYLNCKSEKMINDVLMNASKMGLKVVRCWGFIDGPPESGYLMQPEPGVFDESGFQRLDYTVYRAGQLGLKLVIPFVNYWRPFGGMSQYVAWTGGGRQDEFYTRDSTKIAYKKYIQHVVNRTNSFTKIQYKNDPTIMAWELANEPRCPSDKTGDTLLKWADEMSGYIKSLDKNHLVAVGDEGFYARPKSDDWTRNGYDGADWERLIALPNIDYATAHLYPEDWNKDLDWSLDWILEHIEGAKRVGKPFVLEEFGLKDEAVRDSVYTVWTDAIYKNGGAGWQFWILTGIEDDSSYYGNFDGFRVIYPGKTASLLSEQAKMMGAKSE